AGGERSGPFRQGRPSTFILHPFKGVRNSERVAIPMDGIMPQLGETVAEGTVTKWYKKVGDTVKADDVLFDVETDKVSTEIPAQAAGVLAEILVAEGVTAKVGTRLAVIRESGGAKAAPSRAA